MDPKRTAWYLAGGLAAFNLALFILSSTFLFLGPVHHHWILPFEAIVLGLQYFLLSRSGSRLPRLAPGLPAARGVVSFLLVLTCLIGLLRMETILTCVEGCRMKLVLAWALSGAALLAGSGPGPRKTRLPVAIGILLLLASSLLLAIR